MKSVLVLTIICLIPTCYGISGGQATTVNQFPYSVSMLTDFGTGNYIQACGGTLLTISAVLSAASCYQTSGVDHPVERWRVRVGSTFASSGGSLHNIRLITRHPQFDNNTLDNDVAVVRTTFNVTLIPGSVQTAFIAGGSYTLAPQQSVIAIGWGATSAGVSSSNQLRQVQLFVTEQQTCAERYAPLGVPVTGNMLCAGWLDVGVRGQCQGDTGSPLLHDGVVVGIYSRTEGCGLGRFPSINTRVAMFSRWIVATAVAA